MDQPDQTKLYAVLAKDNEALLEEVFSMLNERAPGDPYTRDGAFAKEIDGLPRGLKAMAATHCLDISLTLDSITWHFGNFGEPGLVAHTEAGLHELGLEELAECFREAKTLMLPILASLTVKDGNTDQLLERHGAKETADQLNERAWALDLASTSKHLTESSVIYAAWVRYARTYPQNVFELPSSFR